MSEAAPPVGPYVHPVLGGVVFGFRMGPSEQVVPDLATGRVASTGIAECWLPGMSMMPGFDVGTVGSAAAIANAVSHAAGRRLRPLPMAPDKLPAPIG